jgi:hypothetical protein
MQAVALLASLITSTVIFDLLIDSMIVACSADGLVLMSSLTLVLDGVLIEPPPPTLPISATAQGNSWAMGSMALTATQPGPAGVRPSWTAHSVSCNKMVQTCREPTVTAG